MNKKLLFVCQHYYPERFGITGICEELVKRGYEITVLTGLPNYPKGKVAKEYKWFKNRKETINGVKVIRCFEIGRRKGKVMLFINYVSFYISSMLKVRKLDKDFDKVISYQLSPITMASAAEKYARKRNKEFILYCFDLWPESLKAYNMKETNPIYKAIGKFSKKLYSRCDKIIVSSKPFIEYFKKVHDIDKKKIYYLPQFSYDYGKYLVEKKVDDKIHFLYAGNIGKVNNIECIIKAVNLLKTNKRYVVDIVGYGSNYEIIKKMISEYKLEDQIILHGEKNNKELNYYYSLADALLLTLTDNSLISRTLPLKLQSYMSTEKPILASANGATKETIEHYKCGICVEAGDYKEFAKVLRKFLDGKMKIKYKKEEKFLLENNVTDLLEIIDK